MLLGRVAVRLRTRGARWLVVGGLAVGALAAQPTDGHVRADDVTFGRAAEVADRVASARKAAASGDAAAARHHALSALAIDPSSPEANAELLRLDELDAELRPLWLLQAALAGADAQGKFVPPKSWAKIARDEAAFAQDAARLRAGAVNAAHAAAAKLAGSAGIAPLRFVEDLAHAAEDGSVAFAAAHETAFTAARTKALPDKKGVVAALLRLAQGSVVKDPRTALAAARLVRAMMAQEPAPKSGPSLPSDAARAAADVIEKVREAQRREEAPPVPAPGAEPPATPDAPTRRVWTADELRAIDPDEIAAWNESHANWANPGVATSPNGLYRVETICGMKTLLAVIDHVETQHRRIAAFVGTDPFEGRQGTIRVCPTDADFEGEGRPFWWASGFQSGDVTSMIARFPSVPGITGTLVHELTHRFDGRALPGMAPWLLEGRATYVASCAPQVDAETLDERFVEWGRLWETQHKGYGTRKSFEDLLRGAIPDYRDNYDAGYALFLFISRFRGFDAAQKGRAVFASRVGEYLKSHAKDPKADPVKRFSAAFADGKDGRPASLDEFVDLFGKFCGEGGSGREPPEPWKATLQKVESAAWDEVARSAAPFEPIFDRPTWDPARSRSDPPEPGEVLARMAAELLATAGQAAPAVEAMRWAVAADEPNDTSFTRLAELEAGGGDPSSAWAARAVAYRLRPDRRGAPEGPPTGAVANAWKAARALADHYKAGAAQALLAGRPRLGVALFAEHDRVAEPASLPLLGELPIAAPVAAPAAGDAPPAPPPAGTIAREPELVPVRSLLCGELVEDRWAPQDTEPGQLWRRAAADILELGRDKPSDDVSGALRDALSRKLSVRTRAWLTGTYTVKTRVRFVSAYADAAIVIGRTTRDRGVEVFVGGGDWAYATGAKKGALQLEEVGFSVSDLSPWTARTGDLRGSARFKTPRDVFDVEICVSGPFVSVSIDGRVRASFRRPGGAPVEGNVAFVLVRGIVRFEEPGVRRHRVLGSDRASPEARFDEPLRLGRPVAFEWDTAPGRRVEGVEPSPNGMLLLWYPEGTPEASWARDELVRDVTGVRTAVLSEWRGIPRTVGVVPKDALEGPAAWLTTGASDVGLDAVAGHSGHSGLAALISGAESAEGDPETSRPFPFRPVWILLDGEGVIRTCGPRSWPWPAIQLVRSLSGR